MAVHDWTRVIADVFHDFHLSWVVHLSELLNSGMLPERHYSMIERHGKEKFPDLPRRTLAIRDSKGHRLVGMLEIVSPACKASEASLKDFVCRIVAALDQGIHILLVDLFPGGGNDARGVHHAIWRDMGDEGEFNVPADKPLTLLAYCADPFSAATAYLEPIGVGDVLPDMPLFLYEDRYVNVPLERAYLEAYSGMPSFWREVLEGRRPCP